MVTLRQSILDGYSIGRSFHWADTLFGGHSIEWSVLQDKLITVYHYAGDPSLDPYYIIIILDKVLSYSASLIPLVSDNHPSCVQNLKTCQPKKQKTQYLTLSFKWLLLISKERHQLKRKCNDMVVTDSHCSAVSIDNFRNVTGAEQGRVVVLIGIREPDERFQQLLAENSRRHGKGTLTSSKIRKSFNWSLTARLSIDV